MLKRPRAFEVLAQSFEDLVGIKRKETVETRNQADTLISISEKTLKDAGDKAKPEDKKEVEDKIAALKSIKDKDDMEALKKAMDELSAAIQKVGAAMYQDQQPASGPQPGASDQNSANPNPNSGTEQGPVDAEYKEVPKDK